MEYPDLPSYLTPNTEYHELSFRYLIPVTEYLYPPASFLTPAMEYPDLPSYLIYAKLADLCHGVS